MVQQQHGTRRQRQRRNRQSSKQSSTPSSKPRQKAHQPSSSLGDDGSAYIGRQISRDFDGEIYQGKVDGYNTTRHNNLWHVTYDDGDAEELDHVEVLLAMEMFKGSSDASYVGRRISRKFGGKTYNGRVDELDEKDRLWHVTFDDGDEEELDHGELLFAMDLFDRSSIVKNTPAKIMESQEKTVESPKNKKKSVADDKPSTTKSNIPTSSFTIPIIVAVIATVIWLCKQMLVANASKLLATNQEDILRSTGLLKFQPDKFQGGNKKKRYFEGWYYKFVSPLNKNNHTTASEDGGDGIVKDGYVTSMAVVPGIFYGNEKYSNESHAFIFVIINGKRQHYYRFHTSEFSYASGKEEYYIQVADNRFTHSGVSLNLHPRKGDDAHDFVLQGELTFTNPSPWPVSLLELGAMGHVGWLPGLECTHGILSFDHVLHGSLTMTSASDSSAAGGTDQVSSSITFDNGRGYTEKDFGRSFPSLWVWIQSNSFGQNPGTSLFVSIARLPVFGLELPGFTAAIWHNSTLIPFATWSGAKFEDIRISKDEVYIAMRSSSRNKSYRQYRVEITVDRRHVPEVQLYAPVNFTKMAPFVWEALQAKVHLRLLDCHTGDVLIDDIGEYAGLEVHGNVQWLVDNVCGKKSANKIICL